MTTSPALPDVLARIWARRLEDVAKLKATRTEAALAQAAAEADPPRPFAQALAEASTDGFALIAEIKKASPSAGLIRPDFDPGALARAYAAGGATCLSVLTEQHWFQGHDPFLQQARAACTLPALRKDFMVDPWQIVESRALGADAVLLILAGLEDGMAREMLTRARALGMAALVEVHDAPELDRALALGADLVGINNRNLRTLTVDVATTEALAPRLPAGVRAVGESGLKTHADLRRLAAAGVRAFLVGESLMRQKDVTAATRWLLLGAEAGA